MMSIIWDGITQADVLREDASRMRHSLSDAAKNYDWPRVFELVAQEPALVNTTRLNGASLYAPLHQVAYGGAPVEVAQRLIGLGAWRTLQNARGERPVDVAERCGHRHLIKALTPDYKQHVPIGVLLKIQAHFHMVIRGRIDQELPNHGLRLPELEPLLELERNGVREEHERLYPRGQKTAIQSAVIGVCNRRQTETRQRRLMRSAKVGVNEAVESGGHGRLRGLMTKLTGGEAVRVECNVSTQPIRNPPPQVGLHLR
jgi:hypothetical protein